MKTDDLDNAQFYGVDVRISWSDSDGEFLSRKANISGKKAKGSDFNNESLDIANDFIGMFIPKMKRLQIKSRL